jgi:hypothetical protein
VEPKEAGKGYVRARIRLSWFDRKNGNSGLSQINAYNFFDQAIKIAKENDIDVTPYLSLYLGHATVRNKPVLMSCIADNKLYIEGALLDRLIYFSALPDSLFSHPAALAMYHGGENARIALKMILNCMTDSDSGRKKELVSLIDLVGGF